ARGKHHVHLAGWRRHRFEIDQRLAHGFVSGALPGLRSEEMGKVLAPAIAVAAGFLAIAFADDDRDIDAHQGAHIAVAFAVAAQDLDHLPARAECDRNLSHARVPRPGIGADALPNPP